MSKSVKQILSVLFYLAVLGCIVLLYDAGKLVAKKLGWIEVPEKVLGASFVNFMEEEDHLSLEIDPELQTLVKKKGIVTPFEDISKRLRISRW